MRTLCALALVALTAHLAHAEIPAFTPNVVDPEHHLDEAETARVNALIEQMRREAGIEAAVWITDQVGDEGIEALANQAFNTWHLGRTDRDNGLLLVLSMLDHHMRFEVGYGLEPDLTDITCKHVLDEVVRPRLRAGHTADAILAGFSTLAHEKNASFAVVAPSLPSTDSDAQHFAWRLGLWAWGAWALLVVFLGFRISRSPNVALMVFLIINPGVFLFIGASLGLGAYLAGGRTLGDFIRAYGLALPYFFGAALAAAYAAGRGVFYAAAQREAFASDAQVVALENQRLRFGIGAPIAASDARSYRTTTGIVTFILVAAASILAGLRYEDPAILATIDLAVFAITWRIALWRVRPFASATAYIDYLTKRNAPQRTRWEDLVRRGHATCNGDGTFAYTQAYYTSHSSSSASDSSSSSFDSSSSSSSFDSSSGGGSSGGGGASSDW